MKKTMIRIILLLVMGIVFSGGMMAVWHNTTGIERLLFIGAISSTLFCFLAIVLFVPIILGTIGVSMASGIGSTGTEGKRPIIFQVPKNHRWILRNVWSSNPSDLAGYEEKAEGWSYYIPTIWHSDEGLVDLAPKQLNLKAFTINCKDGNDVNVDVRATYFVRPEEKAAIKYLLNTAGENIEALVTQRIKVAVNQAMDENSSVAIGWGSDKKEQYGVTASNIASELLKNDRCKDYGVEVVISIENIEPTPEVKAAADRKTAEKYDKGAMKMEAAAIKNMIKETGANPTVVMLAQMASDFFRGKERKGKKNE